MREFESSARGQAVDSRTPPNKVSCRLLVAACQVAWVGTPSLACTAEPTGWVVNADVVGVSASEVYVAGYETTAEHDERGFVSRFDGDAWTEFHETEGYLWSVWAASSDELFAAGDQDGLLRHAAGQWMRLDVDDGTDRSLRDIHGSASNNVFAVGPVGRIVAWDGQALSTHESGTGFDLQGVWVASPTDAFAVGDGGTVLHFDGTAWATMDSGTTMELTATWGRSPTDVYAVGGSDGVEGYVILHYDGTSWTTVDSGTTFHLLGVTGRANGEVLAVGGVRTGSTVQGKVLRQNAMGWAELNVGPEQFLWSAWGTDQGDWFAVGPGDTLMRIRGE